MDAHTVFSDPEQRKVLTEKFFSRRRDERTMSDTRAFLDYLAARPDVKPGGVGDHRLLHGRLDVAHRGGDVPRRIVAAAPRTTAAASRPTRRRARTCSRRR